MQGSKWLGVWRKVASKRVLVNASLVLGAVAAAAWLLIGSESRPVSQDERSEPSHVADSLTGSVQLPERKLATAAIDTHPASIRSLAHTHIVPGRIEYDTSRRLELRLPAECVVKEVFVHPGQQVKQSDRLAVLASKQIGLARDEVKQREEDLSLARYQQQWTDKVATNVEHLLIQLAQQPKMSELEEAFKERPLGDHRKDIVAAYSDLSLAEQVQAESETLGDKGVLSGRTLQERRNGLERARAAFQAVCEETKYTLAVEKQTVATAVARAERALQISSEQLAALLGPYGSDSSSTNTSTNEFVLTAPFDGGIQQLHTRPSEVLEANSPLMTLANTSRLWVSAQIHERNWQAASVKPGQVVQVRTPATGDLEFAATVEFVGATVDAETRALPLVASIDNEKQLFRPGMFVWVAVPVEAERETLAVPSAAVMRHEGEAFVFVARAGNQFRRVNVTTGLEAEGWIEIRGGLIGGERVVDSGAFTLKSELLLEREEG